MLLAEPLPLHGRPPFARLYRRRTHFQNGSVFGEQVSLTRATNTSTGTFESYGYDALGNRTTKTAGATTLTYIYNTANELEEVKNGATLVTGLIYDNNGNLIRKCEGGTVTRPNDTTCSGSTVMTLTYDALNRITQVAKTGISTQTYQYDDQGNRIQKTVGSTETNFLYSGPDIIAEYPVKKRG